MQCRSSFAMIRGKISLGFVCWIIWRKSLPAHDMNSDRTEHYCDVIMDTMASQITSLMIVYSTVQFRRKSKETSKLRVTGLCAGNSPVTGEFPAQLASNAENVSIWWRHHENARTVHIHDCKLRCGLAQYDFTDILHRHLIAPVTVRVRKVRKFLHLN